LNKLPITTFYGAQSLVKTQNPTPNLSSQPSASQLHKTPFNNRYTDVINSNEKLEAVLKDK